MPEQQFTLHLTEGQLAVLEKALDLYSRIGMGQLRECPRIMVDGRITAGPEEAEALTRCRHELEDAIKGVEIPGGVQSITSQSISDEFRVAYDCQQVARHGLHLYRYYKDPDYRQKCSAYVSSDMPRRYSAYEPNMPVLLRRPLPPRR